MSPNIRSSETSTSVRRSESSSTGRGDLADLLERILDKGVVIVGDIRVELLDIELLTIRLRLLVASVDKAREMGISWWEGDPFLTSKGRAMLEESAALRGEIDQLKNRLDHYEGKRELTEHKQP